MSIFKPMIATLSRWLIYEIEKELISNESKTQALVNEEIQKLIDQLQKYIKNPSI